MKYFTVADVHSFYDELLVALHDNNFDENHPEHVLIVCGDLFDRGSKSVELFNFVKNLANQNRLMYVRGNHEDLLFMAMEDLRTNNRSISHHINNGTFKTISEFTGINIFDLFNNSFDQRVLFSKMQPVLDFINKYTVDYAEVLDFIFVHGWVPTKNEPRKMSDFKPSVVVDFPYGNWNDARWHNGMDMWYRNVRVPNKTIVCGHWHTSWGHSRIDNNGSEWDNNAIFETYFNDGIIALDGCTAYSGIVNCVTFSA